MAKRKIKSSTKLRADLHNYQLVEPRWNDRHYSSRRQLRQRLPLDLELPEGETITSRRLKNFERNLRAFHATHIAQVEKEWSAYQEALLLHENGQGEKPVKPEIFHIEELMHRPSGDTQVIQLKDQHEHGMILASDAYIKGKDGKGKRRYLVTSGQLDADGFSNQFKSLKTCEKYHGLDQTAILVMSTTYGRIAIDEDGFIESTMDDIFNGHIVLDANVELNSNCVLDTLRMRPTLGGPLVGLGKIRGKGSAIKSRIFAHPKQEILYVPTPIDGDSRFVATTGSCTFPNYATNKLGQQAKTGELAQRDHIFGGWIVEIENDEVFHIRPLRVDGNGCFSDVFYDKKGKLTAKRFTPNGVEDAEIPYALLGDSHFACKPTIDVGSLKWGTDPEVFEATFGKKGLINELGIPLVGMSDTMDAHSMSHHDEKDDLLMQKKFRAGMLDMEREFINYVDTYKNILSMTTANYLDIAANHNEHPYKYITEERFTGKKGHPLNSINKSFGTKMWSKLDDSNNKNIVELYTRENLSDAGNARITFTKRRVTLIIEGVIAGMHGDSGASGARWSPTTGNNLGLLCMVGHSHTPGIKGSVFTVGTMTHSDLTYTGYLGGWMNTHGLIFKSCVKGEPGQMMLINFIEGRWGWDPTKKAA